jgi:hypothetical protein
MWFTTGVITSMSGASPFFVASVMFVVMSVRSSGAAVRTRWARAFASAHVAP